MQPDVNQRPVMDVKAPVKPTDLMAVRQAPTEPPAGDVPSTPTPQPVATEATRSKTTHKKSSAAIPVGAIVIAILAMISLSALAVAVYMKS